MKYSLCHIQEKLIHFCFSVPFVNMVKQLALFEAALTGLGIASDTCCHLASVTTAYLQPELQ